MKIPYRLPPAVLAACALMGLAGPGRALAETFTLLIYEAPAELALRSDAGPKGKAYWESYARFGKEAQEAGVMRGGGVFVTGEAVRVVTAKKGVVSERAAQGDEPRLGGHFVVEVADAKAAAAWAAKIPAASTGRIVIHPQAPSPAMMPRK